MSHPSHKPSADRTWPKAYLLNIYNQVLEHGAVVLSPIDEAAAKSLKASLYRQRRRSDGSNKTFITPEMHLVTVGKWGPVAGGSLPIYYTTVPDNEAPLPSITPMTGESLVSPIFHHEQDTAASAASLVPELDTIDVGDYVANLIASSKKDNTDD